VCQVSYHRVARTLDSPDSVVRMTLDTALRVTAIHEAQFTHAVGTPLLSSCVILELKYHLHLPAICRRLVERFALSTQTISKYRLGMAELEQSETHRQDPFIVHTGASLCVNS
jgi:hypothetical protein